MHFNRSMTMPHLGIVCLHSRAEPDAVGPTVDGTTYNIFSAAAPASTIFVFATVVTSSLIDLHLGAQVHVQVSGVQVIVIDLDQIVIEHTLAPGDWQIPGPVAGQGRHTHTLRMYALDSLQPAFDLALIAGFHT